MNAPIETTSQSFVFEQVENRDEVLGADEWVAVSVEGNGKAGDGNDSDDRRDGDMYNTTSGSSVDSMQVNEALLASADPPLPPACSQSYLWYWY